MTGSEASLLRNNEASVEIEEIYGYIPERTADIRLLPVPTNEEALDNASWTVNCHPSDENLADPLFYSSANVSQFQGSTDTKCYSRNENTNTRCAGGGRNEASAYSYLGEMEEETYEEPLNKSGYLKPVENKGDDSNDNECYPHASVSDDAGCTLDKKQHVLNNNPSDTLHYNSADVVVRKSPRNDIQQYPSGKKGDRSGQVDIPEPPIANDNTTLQRQSMSGGKPTLPCNNEAPVEMEEIYSYIPEPTADTRPLSVKTSEGALDNESWTEDCHPSDGNVVDHLYYSSANVSQFKGSIDAKGYSRHQNTNTRCASLRRNEPSACSYPEEMEEENYEEPLNESRYIQPVENSGDGSKDNECYLHATASDATGCTIDNKHHVFSNNGRDTLHYKSVDVVECKRPRTDINQTGHCSTTRNDDTYTALMPEKKFLLEYQTLDFSLDCHESSQFEDEAHLNKYQNETEYKMGGVDDGSLYDDVIGCISEGREFFKDFSRGDDQRVAYQSDEDNSSVYDDVIGFIAEDNTRFEKFESKDVGRVPVYGNMTHKLDEDVHISLSNEDAIGFVPSDDIDHFGYQNVTYYLVEDVSTRHEVDEMELQKTSGNTFLGEYPNMTRKLDRSPTMPYAETSKKGRRSALGSQMRWKKKSQRKDKRNACESGASALQQVPQPVKYENLNMHRKNPTRHSHNGTNRHQERIFQEYQASTISAIKHTRDHTHDLSDPSLEVIYF